MDKHTQPDEGCFECWRQGHFKMDCFRLKHKKKQEKALISWSDDDLEVEENGDNNLS